MRPRKGPDGASCGVLGGLAEAVSLTDIGVATTVEASRLQSLAEHLSSQAFSDASACSRTMGRITVVNIWGMAGLLRAPGPTREEGISCLNSSCRFSQRNWQRTGFVVILAEREATLCRTGCLGEQMSDCRKDRRTACVEREATRRGGVEVPIRLKADRSSSYSRSPLSTP